MNPTELNTLRRSLWLTREQAGMLNGMTERSWRYLEDGTRAIPQDVQDRMRGLDDAANAMADAVWDEYANLTASLPRRPARDWRDIESVLLRYASATDLVAAHPEMTSVPPDMHAAAVDRARLLLEAEGASVRIVLFDPAAYRAWIAANGLADNSSSRAAWAASATDPAPKIGTKAASGADSAR